MMSTTYTVRKLPQDYRSNCTAARRRDRLPKLFETPQLAESSIHVIIFEGEKSEEYSRRGEIPVLLYCCRASS